MDAGKRKGLSAELQTFTKAEATIDGTRKETLERFVSVPLLIIDDLGMRKLPMTAAEDLLEIVMRRYEHASSLLTANRRRVAAAQRARWAKMKRAG
jgi:DNA replication protein DnaC